MCVERYLHIGYKTRRRSSTKIIISTRHEFYRKEKQTSDFCSLLSLISTHSPIVTIFVALHTRIQDFYTRSVSFIRFIKDDYKREFKMYCEIPT